MNPETQAFFDAATFTISYLVSDPATKRAAIVDSVLDYDPKSGRTSTASAARILAAAAQKGLTIDWILETHCHADHLSASVFLKEKTGAKVAIGEHIRDVQRVFRPIFNATDVTGDGAPFDVLLKDGQTFELGKLTVAVMHTPGHTPACISYRIGDDVFVGDTLFMPDYGTARTDFPGGDAAALFHSIRKLLALPPHTTLWLCHDYLSADRKDYAWKTTVAEQRKSNVHVGDGVSETAFVTMRRARDKTLAMPVLILPSVQVNMRAGRMPPPDSDGNVYLKIPVDRL